MQLEQKSHKLVLYGLDAKKKKIKANTKSKANTKKILNCFSGHFKKQNKTDKAGRGFILIFIQQKTDAGTFF